jgi:hypothetical protein
VNLLELEHVPSASSSLSTWPARFARALGADVSDEVVHASTTSRSA